jgi:PAS domain S-box-containing protein
LQLKWWHQFQFAGYYAASIKGYYAQQGMDVKIMAGNKNRSPVREVLSGRATFGVTDCDLLIHFAKGAPVAVLGAIFQHSPYIIMATPYKNIYSPSDLIGKTIMGSDDQGSVQLKAMLLKEGIPADSIHLIPHTWTVKDLVNGKTDAMTGYISVEPFQLKKLGIDVNFIDPTNYGIDFYSDLLFTQNDVIENDPGLTEKFRRASLKGWEYAMSHTDEIADYILTLPGVAKRGVTKEDLLNEAEQMRKLMVPDLVEIGHMNEGRWEHILGIYKNLKLIAPSQKLGDFLYSHEDTHVQTIVEKIIYVSVVILLIILGIVLYSLTLKRAVLNRTRQLEYEIVKGNETREKLYLSEERLDLATEAAGIGIWDWNLTDNTTYLSDMWKTMLGYSPNELPDNINTLNGLIHPDDRDEVLVNEGMHIQGVIEKYQFICRMRMKSGAYKWILSISRAGDRDENGHATRIIGIHLDVDDLKKKEIELEKLSQELLISNKELKQFAYITSHNLRSPVANLLMLMQLFKQEELSEKNTILFQKTDQSIKQLNQTLDDLNEILSARFNKTDKKDEVLFDDVLNDVIHSISEEIKNSNAEITSDFSRANKIIYSKKALESILQNLITNAIKYAKPGAAPKIFLSTSQDKEHITLQTKDDGIGIDLDKHGKKIFGLYQRFHNISSGKGLGLYIIKNQVEALNGKIEVDSIAGEGATFTITFKKSSNTDED